LALEQDGRKTVDVPSKFQKQSNVFCIQTAPDASYSRPIEALAQFDVNELLRDIRGKLVQRSSMGLRTLEKIYQAMDTKGTCKLDCDDFRWGLLDYGIQISKEDATELLAYYDADNCGTIHYKDFLSALRVSSLQASSNNCV